MELSVSDLKRSIKIDPNDKNMGFIRLVITQYGHIQNRFVKEFYREVGEYITIGKDKDTDIRIEKQDVQ